MASRRGRRWNRLRVGLDPSYPIYGVYYLGMRKTHALVQVAATLMAEPDEKHWGYNTSKKSGVRPAVLYPIFDRMLAAGWLADGWEEFIGGKNRPPRRYYTVTESGRTQLRSLLDDASRDKRFAALDLGQMGQDLGQTLVGHRRITSDTATAETAADQALRRTSSDQVGYRRKT